MSREVLTESQIRQAFVLYKSGAKIEDIADRYFVSTRTLARMFSRRKLRKQRRHRNFKLCKSVSDNQEKRG